jgi:hypothetical protein
MMWSREKCLTLAGNRTPAVQPVAVLIYLSHNAIYIYLFKLCIVGDGIKVHSTLRPLNGLLCQPWVIMIMEKSVE